MIQMLCMDRGFWFMISVIDYMDGCGQSITESVKIRLIIPQRTNMWREMTSWDPDYSYAG